MLIKTGGGFWAIFFLDFFSHLVYHFIFVPEVKMWLSVCNLKSKKKEMKGSGVLFLITCHAGDQGKYLPGPI